MSITLDAIILVKHRVYETNTLATASRVDYVLQNKCLTRSRLSSLSRSIHNAASSEVARPETVNRRAGLRARRRAKRRILRSNKGFTSIDRRKSQEPQLQLSRLKQPERMQVNRSQF